MFQNLFLCHANVFVINVRVKTKPSWDIELSCPIIPNFKKLNSQSTGITIQSDFTLFIDSIKCIPSGLRCRAISIDNKQETIMESHVRQTFESLQFNVDWLKVLQTSQGVWSELTALGLASATILAVIESYNELDKHTYSNI